MTFVDTNYFLRFLLADNHKQFSQVKKLFLDAAEGKVKLITSTIVFFEIYWVLTLYYNHDKDNTIETMERILNLGFIRFDRRNILADAVKLFSANNLSLEDCFNLCYAKFIKVKQFATFDQQLLKRWEK